MHVEARNAEAHSAEHRSLRPESRAQSADRTTFSSSFAICLFFYFPRGRRACCFKVSTQVETQYF